MFRTLVLIGFSLFTTTLTNAQKPAIQPAPGWLVQIDPDFSKKPAEKEISDGYYLDLSDVQYNVPKQAEYHHIIRHIVNESGVQNASEVSVDFSPAYEKLVFHYINIVRNGKIVSRLSPAAIKVVQEETSASSYQYNDEKRAFVVLEDTRAGDQVDFAWSVIGYNPVFDGKFQRTQYFNYSTPVTNYFISVLSAPEKKLNLHLFNDAPAPVISTYQSLTLHQWKQPELRKWESQSGVPTWFDNYPYFTLTEYNNWQEVVDWGVKVFRSYDYPLSDHTKKKILELQAIAKGDQDLFAELAIKYVQDKIRYLGFEIGAHSHQPHDPNQVFKQGYGDCKDKSLLLARMLQEAGIPAYVAMLNTTVTEKIDQEAPSPAVFNHAIVAIPRSRDYLFIDPTSTNQRGPLVNIYVPAYGKALIIKPGITGFTAIAPGAINHTQVEESLDVKYPGEGNSTLAVKTVYTGGAADYIRDYFSSNSRADINEQYGDYYKAVYDSIRPEGDVEYKDDSIKNEVTVLEHYTISDIWTTSAEGKPEMSVFAKGIFEKLTSPKNHYGGAPLAISYPANLHYVLKISMPDNWSFPLNPVSISNASYTFSYEPSNRDNKIELRYAYKTLKDHVPADELNAFNADYKKMLKTVEYSLYKTGDTEASVSTANNSLPPLYWPGIQLAFVVGSGIFLLLRRWNQQQTELTNREYAPDSFNGWTILMGISIFLSAILQLVQVINEGYFSATNMDNIKSLGEKGLYFTALIELGIKVILISFCAGLLYWYFKKRDIFPRFFTIYIIALFTGNLVLLVLYKAFNLEKIAPAVMPELIKVLFQNVIYGFIWISYVRRSVNVQRCFISPFEGTTNADETDFV